MAQKKTQTCSCKFFCSLLPIITWAPNYKRAWLRADIIAGLAIWAMTVPQALGYAGIAGAPFIIFVLVTFLGYPQHSAQGTVLAMMMGPMTIIPVYYGRDIVRKRIKAILIAILTYMVLSFAGARAV